MQNSMAMESNNPMAVGGSPPRPLSHPPRARLTIRVGVTGHRPNKLGAAQLDVLRARVGEALSAIEEPVRACAGAAAYAEGAPVFRLISALAEGADRLVAEIAIGRGYQLQCVLPFHRDEYETDFETPDSRMQFQALLDGATAVFELEGRRAEEGLAYRAAGAGGTAEVVDQALDLGVPVIRIDSRAPHDISLCGETQTLAELGGLIRRTVEAPDDETLPAYFREVRPKRQHAFYRWFERLALAGHRRKRGQPFEPVEILEVKRHFDWADRLAIAYAARCRSAGVRMQVWAWLAVAAALLPIPLERFGGVQAAHLAAGFSAVELLFILLIVLSYNRANKGSWHKRWLSCRSLAEHLRVLDFMAAIGRTTPEFRPPLYNSGPDPLIRWAEWHFRAIVRELGLRNARVDAPFLARASARLQQVLGDQARFHESTADRCRTIEKRLQRVGLWLFASTLVCCSLHLAHSLLPGKNGEDAALWFTSLAAALPALGAAFSGILAQGEFRRLEARSEAMHKGLSAIEANLAAAAPRLTIDRLGYFADAAAEGLISEVQDWRALFKARPPERPG